MTWHHVAALIIAALMVLVCGLSHTCSGANYSSVINLAGIIVAGAFGHAGAQMRSAKKPEQHEDRSDNVK